ncbi:kinase-like domain-containing protein [Rhizophagus clarus]|uniref:Kinase-like domain-containing protein n=1 Tax=Rhizophagus clarus TaxID=94130 RepID=A0A8H3QBI9_9GLOM|nr:kinase-like domain-containing protein [Rhizophagus clarus]
MSGHESSYSFSWVFCKCSVSFCLSYTFVNKRWSYKISWIDNERNYYNICEENDQLHKVLFFKSSDYDLDRYERSDYDLDRYERSAKYESAKLILCEKCNQKINSIICFECYGKVNGKVNDHENEKEYPIMFGTCGGCFEIIENCDGCLTCKLKNVFINYINYFCGRKFKKCDPILCLDCNRNIDRLIMCFNCYNSETNYEKKCHMKFGRCKECCRIIKGYYGCLFCNQMRFKRKFDRWYSGNTEIDELIRYHQISARDLNNILEWIPYDKFTDIKYIAEGGFAKVYSATWTDGFIINWDQESNNWKRSGAYKVALKVLKNSRDMSLDFINEIKNLTKIPNNCEGIIKSYGITQDPITSNYALVFKLEDCDLRHCLRQYFNSCPNKKQYIENICLGLKNIHKYGLIHKDLHLGNVLCSNWTSAYISDFGFSKPADENSLHTNTINTYGVLPYMAPEILRGKEYTQESDVYSLGIVINEIISEIPPFYNRSHDYYLAIDICRGLRPNIKKDLPDELKELIQKCWDADPNNRPTSEVVFNTIKRIKCAKEALLFDFNESEFDTYHHPQAIYTSRFLSFKILPEPVNCLNQEKFISRCTVTGIKNNYSECLDCAIRCF